MKVIIVGGMAPHDLVIAPRQQLRADRQSDRPAEQRQRDRRDVQDGPELVHRHALERRKAFRRFAECGGRQQCVDAAPQVVEPHAAFLGDAF